MARTKKLEVVLGDLGYFNRYTVNGNYTPLGVGYIATYIKQLFDRNIKISIFKHPTQLIEYVKDTQVHIVGLSLYYWNRVLNKVVIKQLRQSCGNSLAIVLGGPSIDTDIEEQKKIFERFPEINAIVENEGELGFSNIVYKFLSGNNKFWMEPIDGVSFFEEGTLIKGKTIGTTLDLEKLDSPYLRGLMDSFVGGDFRPLIQTSRGCPYTCIYCVAGKNRCKLRKFPLQQVKEEITFLAKKYYNRPHFTLYIADDNFGIFSRDVDIAKYLKKCSIKLNYPRHVFFYNDKKFTTSSQGVIETLGDMNQIGLAVALQSENPATLQAVGRKNLSSEDIDKAIAWASQRNIPTTTEMIFGLPFETLNSFTGLLQNCARRGFDSILCHNLFLMDGIELNRQPMRDKYGLQTKHRLLATNYGKIGDDFCFESEEVVVASKSFSFSDFLIIRNLNFMFYCIYALDFYKWFFNAFMKFNFSLTEFLRRFLTPEKNQKWPDGYLQFIEDLKMAFLAELHSTEDELKAHLLKLYEKDNDVASPSKLNIFFGARLIYIEQWVPKVLLMHLQNFNINSRQMNILQEALLICQTERVDLRNINPTKILNINYDFISWRREKYLTSLESKKSAPRQLLFFIDPIVKEEILSFIKECGHLGALDFYYNVFDAVVPRSKLLYDIDYVALSTKRSYGFDD